MELGTWSFVPDFQLARASQPTRHREPPPIELPPSFSSILKNGLILSGVVEAAPEVGAVVGEELGVRAVHVLRNETLIGSGEEEVHLAVARDVHLSA